jgi:hypothetical protein
MTEEELIDELERVTRAWALEEVWGHTVRCVIDCLPHDRVGLIVRSHEAPEPCQEISPSM